jgi:ABC-type multidrug transport system fused ATPase/permease subunit
VVAGLFLEDRIGTIFLAAYLGPLVVGPLSRLSDLGTFADIRETVVRMQDFLAEPTLVPIPEKQIPGEIHPPLCVELREAGYIYPNQKTPALEAISMTFPPGQMIGVVGPSGSGKSTLASLLLGLEHPTSGQVLINGRDLSAMHPEDVRQNMAAVLQNVTLFRGTILDNILWGSDDLGLEEAIEAAKLVGIHDEVLALPHGYQTKVSEGGKTLSGGQRQRIALARALVRKPHFLVLDEATSALDSISEAIIQERIDALRGHLTLVVIAHRLSTIRNADHILVLDKGAIVEEGTHDDLVARDGRYAEFWRRQVR